MESRLESLINRLEAVVSRAESTNSSTQKPASGSAGPSKLAKAWNTAILPLCEAWHAKTQAHGQVHLVAAVDSFIAVCKMQTAVFNCMATFKPPQAPGFVYAPAAEALNTHREVKQKQMKSPPNHMQTVVDGF